MDSAPALQSTLVLSSLRARSTIPDQIEKGDLKDE